MSERNLNKQEAIVLHRLMLDCSIKQIAADTGWSEDKVDRLIAKIQVKLGVRSRIGIGLAAASAAAARGVLEDVGFGLASGTYPVANDSAQRVRRAPLQCKRR